MLPGGSRITCIIYAMFPGLHLYYTDPAQYIITAGWDLDDIDYLDRDLSVPRVSPFSTANTIPHEFQEIYPKNVFRSKAVEVETQRSRLSVVCIVDDVSPDGVRTQITWHVRSVFGKAKVGLLNHPKTVSAAKLKQTK